MQFSYTVQSGQVVSVCTEPGALSRIPDLIRDYPQALWAVDSEVWRLHESRIREAAEQADPQASFHIIPGGERSKCRAQKENLEDAAFAAGLGRDGIIVAVGGGVTGDLTGYVAATYMRGIALLQVPTTVVSLVDSSIGGKTGIDVPQGKNLIGAFKHPLAIVSDLDFVATLPDDVYRDGFAEIIKHGLIRDRDMIRLLNVERSKIQARDLTVLSELVGRNQKIKADVVSADTQESGLRQILNFGHTIGHAIEKEANYKLSHGLCVAAGMILAARLGEDLNLTVPGTSVYIHTLLEQYGFDFEDLLFGFSPDTLLQAMSHDKKVRSGILQFVLLKEVGQVAMCDGGYVCSVNAEQLLATLRKANQS